MVDISFGGIKGLTRLASKSRSLSRKNHRSSVTILMAALSMAAAMFTPDAAAADYALSFNGTSAYVDTPAGGIPSSSDFTLELWAICPAAPGSYREILSQGSAGNAIYIGTDVGNNIRLGDGWGTVSPTTPFPFGGWHHFAIVKSSANAIFYIDGTNRLTRTGSLPNPTASSGLAFGRQWTGAGELWPGSLDEVRVWNVARTAQDIMANKNRRLTGAEPGLRAYWSFNEGSGSKCTAIGSTNIVGTLVGSPTWSLSGVPFVSDAATVGASSITLGSATLNGSVNPNNQAVKAWFDYGTTTNYGSVSSVTNIAATNASLAVGASISNLSPGLTYNFRTVASNSLGLITGSNMTFQTPFSPVISITMQPSNQVVFAGMPATFTVAGSASSSLSFQWFGPAGAINRATNTFLTVNSAAPSDAVEYTVVLSNALGCVTSRVAQLTVLTAPTAQTAVMGGRASLKVAVWGSNDLVYQWQFSDTNLPKRSLRLVAGNGVADFSGDGGLAANASLNNAYNIAVDADGNLFIADSMNNRIRKVGTDGRISTVAGDGLNRYNGSNMPAMLTSLARPEGVALNSAGRLVIADSGNYLVRALGADGVLTTVAGNHEWGIYSGSGDRATNVPFWSPTALACDGSGSVFIADGNAHCVSKVTPDGFIWTVAGNGTGETSGDPARAVNTGLHYPVNIALNKSGDLFIGDRLTINYDVDVLYRVTPSGGISLLAGGGVDESDGIVGTNATTDVAGLATDDQGNVFLSDNRRNRIRRVGSDGIIRTVFDNVITQGGGGGSPKIASLTGGEAKSATAVPNTIAGPGALALDGAGSLYVNDRGNNRICQIPNVRGNELVLANASAEDAGSYRLIVSNASSGICITSPVVTLSIINPPYIMSQPTNRVSCAGADASFSVGIGGAVPVSYQWKRPGMGAVAGGNEATLNLTSLSDTQAGDYFVVVSNVYGSVTSSLAHLTMVAPPRFTAQPLDQEIGLGAKSLLSVSVSGEGPFTYQWLHEGTNLPCGIISSLTNVVTQNPAGMAMDGAGNLFVADLNGRKVLKVTPSGVVSTVAGTGALGNSGNGGLAINALLSGPSWVAFDPKGNLYICDAMTNTIRKVSTNGIISAVAGIGPAFYFGDGGPATSAMLSTPYAVAVDAMGGLLITDAMNHRIRRVDTNGIIRTVVGNGADGYSGDGGYATNASLHLPVGLACAADGSFYFSDVQSNCVRKVDAAGIITTVAGNPRLYPDGAYAGDNGPATNAAFNYPFGLALDGVGRLYIADSKNNRVRRVELDGTVSTVAGSGSTAVSGNGGPALQAGIPNPFSIAFDDSGAMYVSEMNNQVIRKITPLSDSTLNLGVLTTNTLGNYQVVVTSQTSGGSITSVVASVSVPTIRIRKDNRLGISANRFGFNMSAPSNQTVVVEATTNLASHVWSPLLTNTLGTNAFYFSDTNSTKYPTRIYRLRGPQ